MFYDRSFLTNAPVFLTDFPNMAPSWRRVLNPVAPRRKNLWFKPVNDTQRS